MWKDGGCKDRENENMEEVIHTFMEGSSMLISGRELTPTNFMRIWKL
jgi:hypothetical protein